MRDGRTWLGRMSAWGAAVAVMWPAAALAQGVDGRVRLSLEGGLFRMESFKLEDQTTDQQILEGSESAFGLASAGVGPGVGIGLSDHFLLGGRLAFASASRTVQGGGAAEQKVETSEYSLLVVPEVILAEGTTLPFVFGNLGVRGASVTSGADPVRSTTMIAGLGFGAHVFVIDTFSIDPSLSVSFVTGKEDAGVALRRTGSLIFGGFAFSTWFGGREHKRDRRDDAVPDGGISGTALGYTPASPVTAAPAPKPRPASPSAVKWRIQLGTGEELILSGDAADAGEEIDMVMRVPAGEPLLDECETIGVELEGQRIELSPVVVQQVAQGFGKAYLLETSLRLSDLARIAASSTSVEVRACERSWELLDSHREEISHMVRAMRRRMRRSPKKAEGGQPFEVAPAAEPSAEEADAEASGGGR